MNIGEFFRNADAFALTITIAYLGVYVGLFFYKRGVGNVSLVQKRVIYGLAKQLGKDELIDIIHGIIDENPRLLMPINRNWILHSASFLFIFSALITIFYDGWVHLIPSLLVPVNREGCFPATENWQYYISNCFVINIDITYSTLVIFFVLSLFLLYLEARYWHDFKRLKDEHYNSFKGKIKITIEE